MHRRLIDIFIMMHKVIILPRHTGAKEQICALREKIQSHFFSLLKKHTTWAHFFSFRIKDRQLTESIPKIFFLVSISYMFLNGTSYSNSTGMKFSWAMPFSEGVHAVKVYALIFLAFSLPVWMVLFGRDAGKVFLVGNIPIRYVLAELVLLHLLRPVVWENEITANRLSENKLSDSNTSWLSEIIILEFRSYTIFTKGIQLYILIKEFRQLLVLNIPSIPMISGTSKNIFADYKSMNFKCLVSIS